jgi:hypothetical protein
MKIVGGLILWGVIAVLFFRWFAVEQRGGWDELAGAHLEREIRRGMRRPDERVRIER